MYLATMKSDVPGPNLFTIDSIDVNRRGTPRGRR